MPLTLAPGSITFTARDRQRLTVTASLAGTPAPLWSSPAVNDPADASTAPTIAAAGGPADLVLWMPAGTYTFTVTDSGTVIYGPTVVTVTPTSRTVVPPIDESGGGTVVTTPSAPLAASVAPDPTTIAEYYDTALEQLGISDGVTWHYFTPGAAVASGPAFRTAVAATYPTSTHTAATVPMSAVVGDLMLMALCATVEGAAGTWTPPAGWTLVAAAKGQSGQWYNMSAVYQRNVGAGDAGTTFTFTSSPDFGAGGLAGALLIYDGVTVDAAIANTYGVNVNGPWSSLPVTTTHPADLIVTVASSVGHGPVVAADVGTIDTTVIAVSSAYAALLVLQASQTDAALSTARTFTGDTPSNGTGAVVTVALSAS